MHVGLGCMNIGVASSTASPRDAPTEFFVGRWGKIVKLYDTFFFFVFAQMWKLMLQGFCLPCLVELVWLLFAPS